MSGGANLSSLVAQALFVAIIIVMILINVKHAQGCRGYDAGDPALRRAALEHRLVVMEKEVKENSELLHAFITNLDAIFDITAMTELRALKRECHAEAVAIVGQLADGAPPPMPTFTTPGADDLTTFRDDLYQDDLFAASKNDFTEARYDDAIAGGGNSPYGDDRVLDLPPTEERSKSCREWRTAHAVSPGVSWGTLPLDLQMKWKDYDCDMFLLDSVQGMLADADSHEERAKSLAAAPDQGSFVDDYLDDFVGEISSIKQ